MNRVEKTVRAVDRLQQRHPWLAFPVAVWKKFGDDRAGNLAGLIAFTGFAAIFPLLLVMVTVLDITMRNYPSVKASLEHSALAQFPVVGQEINRQVGNHEISGRGLPLAVGIIFTVLGSRGVANAMQNALNEVWGVPLSDRPGFPWNWLRSLGLIAVIGGGLVLTSTLSGLAVAGPAKHVLGGVGAAILGIAVSLVLNVGVFLLAFRLATAKDVSWRDLRLGAVIAAVVWQVLLSLGSYIVGHQLHHSSPLYGTFAVVLGLMAWLYLQAQATLYAAEANVVRVKRLWPRALVTPPLTKADRQARMMEVQTARRDKDEVINVTLIPEQGEQEKGSDKGGDQHRKAVTKREP